MYSHKPNPTRFRSSHDGCIYVFFTVMVSNMQWIVFFTVCGASCVAQSTPSKFDTVKAAVFSSGLYPNAGDIPLLNRKVFRAMRVSVSEHPYVVSIRRLHAHYLTGAILTAHVIVSVAHPLYNVPVYDLGVVAGENYNDRGSSYLTVLLVVTHEQFDPYTLVADLALLQIFEGILTKVNQKPIPIFSDFMLEQKYINSKNKSHQFSQNAFVTGWGRCDWMGTEMCLPRASVYFPDEVQDPMLQTISFNHSLLKESSYCVGYDKNMVPLARRKGMLCVGPAREEQPLAPCLAVPGAPLTVLGRLAGLQSWGFSCGYMNDLPTVYTDMRYHTKWLQKNLGILYTLDPDDVSELYIATRAYTVQSWLMQTSNQTPVESHHHEIKFQTTKLDKRLIELRGNVADFRNYAYGGKLKMPKAEMYAVLKREYEKEKKIKEIRIQLRTNLPRAFLNEEFSNLVRMNDTVISVKGKQED